MVNVSHFWLLKALTLRYGTSFLFSSLDVLFHGLPVSLLFQVLLQKSLRVHIGQSEETGPDIQRTLLSGLWGHHWFSHRYKHEWIFSNKQPDRLYVVSWKISCLLCGFRLCREASEAGWDPLLQDSGERDGSGSEAPPRQRYECREQPCLQCEKCVLSV